MYHKVIPFQNLPLGCDKTQMEGFHQRIQYLNQLSQGA